MKKLRIKLKHDPTVLLDPLFNECIKEAAGMPDLVKEFDRLNGTNLSRKGSPLDLMIDDSTGRMSSDLGKFVEFVREFVYEPLKKIETDEWWTDEEPKK